MPKQKSHSSSKKRFRFTKNGKIKRAKAYKNHFTAKKARKTIRNLRRGGTVDSTQEKTVKKMIPYKA